MTVKSSDPLQPNDGLRSSLVPWERRIFCNRTLNMRQVHAIGYDMDYTLIHYRVEAWEAEAYETAKNKLKTHSWPVQDLQFQPDLMVRGLVIDTQLGNTLKVNSYGQVKQALHGTRSLSFPEQQQIYANQWVSLSDPRFVFLNTLFSLSEACLYAQLVDLLDQEALPSGLGYADVYRRVRASLDEAHLEGTLKDKIIANPAHYVEHDPDMPHALLDQYYAGKKLLLITNADWRYVRALMDFVFSKHLPKAMQWRDLFHLCFVSARKPEFFSQRNPLYEVVSDDGLLRPVTSELRPSGVYWGGDASIVEDFLKLSGQEILYVGDHIYGDVNVSKRQLRWRTALVLYELEREIEALKSFEPQATKLAAAMAEKQTLESEICRLRLARQRLRSYYGAASSLSDEELARRLTALRDRITHLDSHIAPLAEQAAKLGSSHWGPWLRAGNDKSHLARQIERYADIYLSRVSNFLAATPYAYLRSLRGNMPHDPGQGAFPERQDAPY